MSNDVAPYPAIRPIMAAVKNPQKAQAPWLMNANTRSIPKRRMTEALKREYDGQTYDMRAADLARFCWDLAKGRIPGSSVRDRIDMTKFLFDRLEGPVRQEIEAGPPGSFDALAELSDENLDAIIGHIRTVAATQQESIDEQD